MVFKTARGIKAATITTRGIAPDIGTAIRFMIDRLDHFKNIRDPSSLGKVLLVFEMGLGNFFLCLAATM